MPLALVICAATVFVLCAWYFQRRHRALEARMTQQVKERYAAYIDLEERVRVALGEFDRLEASFEIEVRKSRDQIKNLEQALDAVEGVESSTTETPGGFLGILDEGDASVQAQPVTLIGEAHDFEAELQNWERRVEAAQHEKRHEIERQRQQIEELTARLRHIEPSSTRRREEPAPQAQPARVERHVERHVGAGVASGDLEQRLEQAERAARELLGGLEGFWKSSTGGIEGLRETLASCKPLLEDEAQARARAAQLEGEHEELEKSCAALEQRCGALDGRLRERESELASAKQSASELEARGQESARRLSAAGEELETLRRDLQGARDRGEREALAREELARSREELVRSATQIKGKLDEECARSASLNSELDGARARLERYEKERAELEQKGLEQGVVLQAQTEMLHEREEEISRLRIRIGALESKLLTTRESIGGQKTRLSELMDAIQVAQKEQVRHKELLSEQSQHMQEARELLEALRPVMDTLEGDLEKKQSN